MRKVLGIACLTVGVLMSAGQASATPVSFQGGEFDVTFTDQGSNVYRFVYTADFTNWDDSTSDDFITALDFGFSGWNDVNSVTLVSDTAPGNWVVMQGNGSANNCNENSHQFKICAQEDPLALSATTDNDQIYTWTIDVAYDSIGDLGALTGENPIKAVFYKFDCKTKKGVTTCEPKQTGNMSLTTDYGSTSTTTTTTTTTTPSTTVTTTPTTTPTTETSTPSTTNTPSGVAPEPTVMTLLGAGLMLVSSRLRRRSN